MYTMRTTISLAYDFIESNFYDVLISEQQTFFVRMRYENQPKDVRNSDVM